MSPHTSGRTHTHGYQIINAFMHPQKTSQAFQLSEKQLKSFADLGIADDIANIPCVDTVLPFAEEPDARTELTFVRVGEAPLRIYKNEYDKQPVSWLPEYPSCVITENERMTETMKIVEEQGWYKQPIVYPRLSLNHPSPEDESLPRDAASSSSPNDDPPSANRKGL